MGPIGSWKVNWVLLGPGRSQGSYGVLEGHKWFYGVLEGHKRFYGVLEGQLGPIGSWKVTWVL